MNLKGGVGKTALAVNFAAYCGSIGKKTLLIDMDPQTNATLSCITGEEWQQHAKDHGTVAHLLGAKRHTSADDSERPIESVIRKAVFPGVDLIPSHLDLFTIDLDLASTLSRETKLKRALKPIVGNYDIIVCDCPPNLTIPTQNALAISTHYVVPISPDFLAAIGVGLLMGRIKRLAAELETSLDLAGIVFSKVGRPSEHRATMKDSIRAQYGTDVLSCEIIERSVVSEAAEKKIPIYNMGNADPASEFKTVSKEILKRMGCA